MREYEVILSEIVIEEKIDEDTEKKTYVFLEGVDGIVLIKVPNYVERLKIMDAQGLKAGGETDIKAIIKIVETCSKYIVKVEAKIDGQVIDSFDELGMFQKGVTIINHIFSVLAGGIPSKKI